MVPTAGAEPGWADARSQEFLLHLPCGWPGTQALAPSAIALPGTVQGAEAEVEQLGLELELIWPASDIGRSLTGSAQRWPPQRLLS